MLLRRKLIIFAMFFLFLFSTVSYAQVCEVDGVKQVLKKILYLYFTEPASVSLTKDEVKDLLVFYLSISAQNLTADCSDLGAKSNRPIFDVMSLGENLPDKVPSCVDGTKYGECSKFRPAYCYAGALYSKCDVCGCPSNSVCGKVGKCTSLAQNITCFKDIDCGQNTFTGDYYCTNNYIARNYLNYTCVNPGTTSSKCSSTNGTVWLTYCSPSLNQVCVNGQNTCQTSVNDSAPTVSISVTPTTVAQGQFFNVTVTGTDDVGLAAIWWWGVNTADSELNKAHWYNCNGARFCTYSWLVSTNATGTLKLAANSRDTAYPVAGQPHQASEGAGIAYATITISSETQINQTTLPAPIKTGEAGTYFGAGWPLAVYSQSIRFYYDANYLSKVSTFRVYEKKPGQSTFNLIGTFNSPSPLATSCSGYVTSGTWNLRYYCGSGFWEAGLSSTQPSSYFPVGEYNYYITAVDSLGGESTPSSVLKGYVLQPTTVISPTSTQSPVSATPTIQWTIASGWPAGFKPSYYIQIYPESTSQVPAHYVTSVTVDPTQSTASKVYDGSSFDPNKKYIMEIRSSLITSDRISYISMAEKVETFWVGNQTNVTNTSKPDLIVSDITFNQSNPTTADYTRANITIKNIGTATAWNFSLKVDHLGGQSFLFGWTAVVPGQVQSSYLDNYWPAGTHRFTATVDIDNKVAEIDENNNILSKNLIVTNKTNTTIPSIVTLQGSDGTWCYDPDGYGSVNISAKKYCQDNVGTHDDYCETSSLLRDWYCTGTWNGVSWSQVKCAAGGYSCNCVNGACT